MYSSFLESLQNATYAVSALDSCFRSTRILIKSALAADGQQVHRWSVSGMRAYPDIDVTQ